MALRTQLSHLKQAARRRLAPLARRLNLAGAYRGSVDGLVGGELHGWVVRNAGNGGGVRVGLFVAGGLLTSRTADYFRADVRDAGIGDGHCGFVFPIDEDIRGAAERQGGTVYVRVLEGGQHEIGRCELPRIEAGGLIGKGPLMDQCRKLLYGDLDLLGRLFADAPSEPDMDDRAPLVRHARMFETRSMLPEGAGPTVTPEVEPLPAYLDYTKFRMRKERDFDTEGNPEDRDQFLNWYLTTYSPARGGLRVPLSKDLIAYLNQPQVIGGQKYSPTRFMWWRLVQNRALMKRLDLSNDGFIHEALYWWAWTEAPALHVEDCLVTRRQADVLRSVNAIRRGEAYPMSVFMDRLHAANSEYHFLDPRRVEDRQLFNLCLMVVAGRRPDVLRYLPHSTVVKLLERPSDNPSIFESFLQALTPRPDLGPVGYERYAAAMRIQGFDLFSQSFLSLTPEGHRLEAAALPRVTGEKVDVQMIGPFEKASGLGQATRISAEIMRHTGIPLNCVDFGLDNPAPEGFSKVGKLGNYRPAKVNLIHLNSESIPLAFAYEPDVFSDAYNIGYFFWELNSPALCHYLGMDLLDEIWVATDYGVSIYAPEAGKPVVNVGMAYEEVSVDRAEARAFLDRRFHLESGEFVFLVAFDSFSFVQRKNPIGVLEAFRKAFPGDEPVRLIVKTQNRDNVFDPVQERIWNRVEAICARDPRIVVMNETLTYEALVKLKAGSDCYISLHRSEGWGFGMIEAMNLGVPVVCTAYSGNMDFCSDETAWLVKGEEVALAPDDYIFVRPGQKWCEPDIADAARQLRAVWTDPEPRAARVAAALANVRNNFSAATIAKRYEARLRDILKDRT